MSRGETVLGIARGGILATAASLGLAVGLDAQELSWDDEAECWAYATEIGGDLPAVIPYGDAEGLRRASAAYSRTLAILEAELNAASTAPPPIANERARFLEACYDVLEEELDDIRQALENLDIQGVIAPAPAEARGGRGARGVDPVDWARINEGVLRRLSELAARFLEKVPPFENDAS